MNFKKWITAMTTAALLTVPFSAQAEQVRSYESYIPVDIDENWAYDQLDNFLNADVITGYPVEDGYVELRPDATITRAQFIKILVNALQLTSNQSGKSFTDVKADDWYAEYVQIGSSLGIISGSNGKFMPDQKITREQLTAFIIRAFENTIEFNGTPKAFTDVPNGYWAKDTIDKASSLGIVNGYDTLFKPRNHATRAQAMVMIQRALDLETNHLPSEQALHDVVKSFVQEENRLFEASDFTGLQAHYSLNTLGYYRALASYGLEEYEVMIEEGVGFTISIEDTFGVSVLSATDRYATVEVTDLIYYFTISEGDMTYENTMTLDGVYHLQKQANGNWKIYNYAPAFDNAEVIDVQ
ncbi:S-layer homology domain-containing protein [Bacillus salitolerans]|uniref:S-layer homology domain-containing protein n=1 Tax=Bacillus salitolerans TaxID=1437434 RepID=A0ABW4LQR4_9BACI